MGRIQSNVGLVTGVPIAETVNQLLSFSARPRDQLLTRVAGLQQQQVAIGDLTAAVIAIQLASDRLAKAEVFSERSVSSSDSSLLSAIKTGDPAAGKYQFTPVRLASSQQLISGGFVSKEDPLGAGTLRIRFGGFVDKGVQLADLNEGAGVERGKIRITDRDGGTAAIDLSFARTIDDVLLAINSNDDVQVTASVSGDALKLTDGTSGAGNLRVQEIGLGNTAADLGLAGIDTGAAEATGLDVLRLYENLALSRLNDGNGVQFNDGLDDIEITFRDGSPALQIDFDDFSSPAKQSTAVTNAANGVDAEVTFTAVTAGGDADNVTIRFVGNAAVTKGNETVAYDDSDPNNKTLIFQIDDGLTDADDIVAALAADPTASALFTSQAGGDGSGVIATTDIAVTAGGAAVAGTESPDLGDLRRKLEEIDPTRLGVRVDASGDRIELVDLTSGSGTFAVTSLFGGSTAEDLGLTGTAVAGVITSRRLQAGLSGVLLSSLDGGQGISGLGAIDITDRGGGSATVDLSTAETLNDVVDLINASAARVTARINDARNGLTIDDTSGGSNNLLILNGDATNSADALQITANTASTSVDSGSLSLQVLSEDATLDSLRQGKGISDGSFLITDANGTSKSISFSVSQPETVGDVIDLINGLGLAIDARINDAGDGIALLDTTGGQGTITVADSGTGTTAAELGIAGTSTEVSIGGTPTQVIDGSTTLQIDIDAGDTLEDVVEKINDLAGGVAASIFNEGSGTTPFRLSLVSEITGSAGELLVDSSQAGFSFEEVAKAQDALLLVGGSSSTGGGILASSSDNSFDGVLDGVALTITGESTEPVVVSVDKTDSLLVDDVQLFVTQFNALVDKLEEYTFFNEVDQTTGVLFGTSETLRIESTIADLASSSYFGAGDIRSLAEVGIDIDEEGKLSLDEAKLQAKFQTDPEEVEKFFTTETVGFSDKVNAAIESLAGEGNSLLINRTDALQAKIDVSNDRIEFLNERLDRERDSLFKEFFALEETIARMQSNLNAIAAIQPIAPLVSLNR